MNIPEPEASLLNEALKPLVGLAQAAICANDTDALRRRLNELRMASLGALTRLNDAETVARWNAHTPEYN